MGENYYISDSTANNMANWWKATYEPIYNLDNFCFALQVAFLIILASIFSFIGKNVFSNFPIILYLVLCKQQQIV